MQEVTEIQSLPLSLQKLPEQQPHQGLHLGPHNLKKVSMSHIRLHITKLS